MNATDGPAEDPMGPDDARTVGRLRQLAGSPETDRHLLGLFAADRDGAAFAELVRRHGPMVLGVCRRVLRNDTDAEDAFQATFLVLARKAGSVRDAGSLANWLFGVARRVSLRLGDAGRRRDDHERRLADRPEPTAADPGREELLAILDDELRRLPERLRAPLVACHLEGRTQEEAAREMGWSLSTLRRRLDRGKEVLRARLTGRGVALPAAFALTGMTATVPAALADATARAAVGFAHGEKLAAPAAALAEGVLAMMARTKVKLAAGVVLAVAVLGGTGGVWGLAQSTAPQPRPAPAGQGTTAAPKPADPPPAAGQPPKAAEDRIKPGDRLRVHLGNPLPDEPLTGVFLVEASGKISLGPTYGGRVEVGGLTLEEAEAAVRSHLIKVVTLRDPRVQVTRYDPLVTGQPATAPDGRIKPGDRVRIRVPNAFEIEPINGVYLVEPTGKVSLGPAYGGRVSVGGLTLEEAEVAIRDHLAKWLKNPAVQVTRYDPVADAAIEQRVRMLEQEVKELRAAVEELRRKGR